MSGPAMRAQPTHRLQQSTLRRLPAKSFGKMVLVRVNLHIVISAIRQTNGEGLRRIEHPNGGHRLPAENFGISFGRYRLDVRPAQDNQSSDPFN
jgi:hypothetical protein